MARSAILDSLGQLDQLAILEQQVASELQGRKVHLVRKVRVVLKALLDQQDRLATSAIRDRRVPLDLKETQVRVVTLDQSDQSDLLDHPDQLVSKVKPAVLEVLGLLVRRDREESMEDLALKDTPEQRVPPAASVLLVILDRLATPVPRDLREQVVTRAIRVLQDSRETRVWLA